MVSWVSRLAFVLDICTLLSEKLCFAVPCRVTNSGWVLVIGLFGLDLWPWVTVLATHCGGWGGAGGVDLCKLSSSLVVGDNLLGCWSA